MDDPRIPAELFYTFTIEEQDLDKAIDNKKKGMGALLPDGKYYTPSCHCVTAEALRRQYPDWYRVGWARSTGDCQPKQYGGSFELCTIPEQANQIHALTCLFDDAQYGAVRKQLPLTVVVEAGR